MLKEKTILLGVTGGIAAYKAAALCSALVKRDCNVRVVMTENATKFISPLTFEALSRCPVATDTFNRSHPYEIEHIALADCADLVLIAPASADVIAKLACGIADDMLTTTVLACDCPKIIAPAMNTKMFENPVTQENISKLKKYGWYVAEPETGRLACGTIGKGKMAEPETLLEYVSYTVSHKKDLKGQKVLVTAGPTREDIDPVRFLTNHSSGKMGYALAEAAAARGAEVTLISGPVNLKKPLFVNTINVTSAGQMYTSVIKQSETADIIIKAAAVADWRPKYFSSQKIKKGDSKSTVLELERTEDILETLGTQKKEGQFICGFSMETENLVENSKKKLKSKNLDLVAANSLSEKGAGFECDTNIITLIDKSGEKKLPLAGKREAADMILDRILELQGIESSERG